MKPKDIPVAALVVVSMLLTWLVIPHTTGSVNSLTSKIGSKYFGAALVGFFELLAYGTAKGSLRIAALATVIGTIGSVILYEG